MRLCRFGSRASVPEPHGCYGFTCATQSSHCDPGYVQRTAALTRRGQELMSLLKQDFATHFPRYRLYMYVGAGGEVGLTSHLDGRKYVADAQRPAHWRDLQPC